jgi:hypothetical protein
MFLAMNSINRLVFVAEKDFVSCEVLTEFIYSYYVEEMNKFLSWSSRRLKPGVTLMAKTSINLTNRPTVFRVLNEI